MSKGCIALQGVGAKTPTSRRLRSVFFIKSTEYIPLIFEFQY